MQSTAPGESEVPATPVRIDTPPAAVPIPRPTAAVAADPRSPEAEAYRTLAVNLQYASQERPLQVILITSPAAGDGKTTAAANLAVAWAEAGRTVLAVDADLRRPGLHTVFGLDNRLGLTTALRDPSAPLPIQDTSIPGLRLLASGPEPVNPAEALASDRFAYVFDRLREEADIVVIDCAPAAVLADATLIATRADGVLLVIGAGKTNRDLATLARENLTRVHANLLGAVLVGARTNRKLFAY